MSALRNAGVILFVTIFPRASIAAPTFAEAFAYAANNYPALFSGTPVAGKYLQYSYLYYPASGNYLAVDGLDVLWMLGPATKGVITSIGPLSNFSNLVTSWKMTVSADANVSRFNGTYTGTIGGQRQEAAAQYPFTVTILNGVLTGSAGPAVFTGRVSASGAVNASATIGGPPIDCPGINVVIGQITISSQGIASAAGTNFSPGNPGFCSDATSKWSSAR